MRRILQRRILNQCTPRDLETCKPPDNDKWAQISVSHVVTLRVAWLLMGMTKTKMVERLPTLTSDGLCKTLDSIDAAIAFHRQALLILEKAGLRLAVAASVVEREGGFEKEATS